MADRYYIAIDMKSFYASVECVSMGLDPLKANLLVADPSRSDKTICLAVSPALKAIGVPSRPRLFEARQAIRKYEREHHTRIEYITAVPRMAEYERVSALIYSVILRYAAPEDVHVYSVDESFIDATPYLHFYEETAQSLPIPESEMREPCFSACDREAQETGFPPHDRNAQEHTLRKSDSEEREPVFPLHDREEPGKKETSGFAAAHAMAMVIIRDILKTTGITATVGIGTNLYLAKVAMDIVAKKAPPDRDGVRIAQLDEASYCFLLWDHRPLTDFWMIGPGKARRLEKAYLFTMGDIAQMSQLREEWFYKTFGIDGEILIAHAWGYDPVTMADIHNYHSSSRSLSSGQVLPRPYPYSEARNVFSEMIDSLCADMASKHTAAPKFSWWVSYDYKSLEACPDYEGPVCIDFYGRLHPCHANGTVRMPEPSNAVPIAAPLLLEAFDKHTDHRLLYRRLGICAEDVITDSGCYQLNFFMDYEALAREKHLQEAIAGVRAKFGANALFQGKNLLEGATQLERNAQIGGHRA